MNQIVSIGPVLSLAAVFNALPVNAGEFPLVSKERAIATSIEQAHFPPETELEQSARLIQGSETTLAPIRGREVNPQALKRWIDTLAGKSIWRVRLCPLHPGKRTVLYCSVFLIDAESGKYLAWP